MNSTYKLGREKKIYYSLYCFLQMFSKLILFGLITRGTKNNYFAVALIVDTFSAFFISGYVNRGENTKNDGKKNYIFKVKNFLNSVFL